MRGVVGEWTGIMCMIPRPFQIQLEQENSDFCLRLGLLALALLKGPKRTKKTIQQSNGGGERVVRWENEQGSCA